MKPKPLLELTAKQQELVSAALRHVRDARHLFDPANAERSIDQAFHLAGFGPECMRKALLGDRVYDRVLGHRFDTRVEELLEAILALDPLARRYYPKDWARRWPAFDGWTEQARYEPTGRRTEGEAAPLVSQASDAVHRTLAALWADGRLPAGFAW